MYLRNQFFRYEATETGETPSGSGASTPPADKSGASKPTFDPSSPEIKAYLDEQIASVTRALKQKNEELIGEKRKLTEVFGDLDRDTVKSYLERLKTDEESRLIAEGKIDEVVDRRTQRMRESFQSKLDETSQQVQVKENEFTQLRQQYENMLVDNEIRAAAAQAEVVPSAMDDVIARAKQYFIVENDKLISKDPYTDEPRLGADGKTPYGPADFMIELKKSAPHFWPSSSGGGFSPGNAPSGSNDLRMVLTSKGFEAYRKARKG